MSLVTALAAASLAALALPAPPASAGETVRLYRSLAYAPGGERLAAVESDETADQTQTPHGRVVVRSRDGRVLGVLDPCAACRYGGLAFSPDGRSLALVSSDPKSGTATVQVYADGALKVLTTVKGTVQSPHWSPDGSLLAVLATPGAHKQPGATQAGRALTGEIGADVDEQRIAVAPLAGGPLRFVSPADTWVYEFAWTPEGSGFVATAAKGDGDDNWWTARLERFDAASGAETVLLEPSFQMNQPSVSPDGKTVAFIGGLMSDFGSVGGDVYTLPLSGGSPRDLTDGFKGTITSLTWSGPSLMASALVSDRREILSLDPRSGVRAVRLSAPPGESFSEAVLSGDGRSIALIAQGFERPPEIKAGPLGDPRTVTTDNAGLKAHVAARSVTWSSEGLTVQGWLLSPPGLAPGRTYPMITDVHGGPSAAWTPSYVAFGSTRDLLDKGYLVFEPNPRGSYGQGEAFTRANVRDLGGGDLRDILAGVDAVEALAPVDDRRLGVMGGSYGGFMTMWAVTHTDRFHAAVAGAGISDWLSYYGENGIDKWMIPFFGASAYDDPAIYDKLSPIRSIRNAKTPTFIYVGERDVECPPAQSIEFWHGLKAMGVPVSLVIYEGEGHGVRGAKNVLDLKRRIADWFDRYLAPAPQASTAGPRS